MGECRRRAQLFVTAYKSQSISNVTLPAILRHFHI